MKHFHNVGHSSRPNLSSAKEIVNRPRSPVYRVGELFRRGRQEWPVGTQLEFGPAGCELILIRARPDHELIEGVRRGCFRFALLAEGPVIVLSYALDGLFDFEEALYCWHLHPEDSRVIPVIHPSPEARALLWITLVGADDGIVHAQRGVTLSPIFTRALHGAIRRQAMSRFRPSECVAAISRIFLEFPDPSERLAMAVVRTSGNE